MCQGQGEVLLRVDLMLGLHHSLEMCNPSRQKWFWGYLLIDPDYWQGRCKPLAKGADETQRLG